LRKQPRVQIAHSKKTVMKAARLTTFLLLFLVTNAIAQNPDSVTAPASSLFKISKGRTFWMGLNYRPEWTTPVRVPVVNMATEGGGLKPTKQGGGKQTRSLRLEDASGKEYNFRSIQKFITSKTLPADLQSEAAEDLVADGISASYPFAALSMPVLAEAAGVPYLKVKLVYIPDDPRLGEYRKDFANLLAYLEEKTPDTMKKDYDTEDVVEKLQEDNDHSVDQKALLRARILDMFVMDFDRHEGQWEWGAIEKEKGKQFYAVPKDRDQAFYTNQGVVPHIAQWSWLVPQLEGLKPAAKNIKRFNFAARNLDRFFLNSLTEEDWKNEATIFLSRMTDDVIEKALAQQPPEIRHFSGDKIIGILKERRNHLLDDVMEYYRFLAEKVDIHASDKPELFEITRDENNGNTLVQVFKYGDQQKGDKLYERTFNSSHTEELRIYAFGGNDKFVVNGNDDKIKIRMIGGDGDDHFENAASSAGGGIIYDEKRGSNTVTGKFRNKFSNDTLVNHYDPIYFKYNQVIPFISVGFNPDDGVYLGGYLKVIRHGFRKSPYKNTHSFAINRALASNAFNLRYNGEFIGIIGRKTDLLLEADLNAPSVRNFFGFGENTVYDKSKPGKFRYYRTRYELGDFSIQLRRNFSEKVVMTIGPALQLFEMDSTDKNTMRRFIGQEIPPGLDRSTAFSRQTYIGGRFTFTVDTRDNRVMPQKGVYWYSAVRHLSGLNDTKYDVTQVNSDLSFHIPIIKKRLMVIDRVGAGHNFGDFEFHQAQYLGSEDNLRGYRRFRFAGHSKFYKNIEMRLLLAKFKTYLFPGSLGILAFYDTGRIWADNDDSDKWLNGYGGGFWVSPLQRMVLTVSYAISKEDRLILAGLGWRF
jgi:hypothetical protein